MSYRRRFGGPGLRRGLRAGSVAGDAYDFRLDVDGAHASWRYGVGETKVSGALQAWTDAISSYTLVSPGGTQRPTDTGTSWGFDSTEPQYLEQTSSPLATILRTAPPHAFYAVVRNPGLVVDGSVFSAAYPAGSELKIVRSVSGKPSFQSSPGFLANGTTDISGTIAGVLAGTWNGSAGRAFWNGAQEAESGGASLTPNLSSILIGSSYYGGALVAPYGGEVMEVFVCLATHTLTTAATISAQLAAWWGV